MIGTNGLRQEFSLAKKSPRAWEPFDFIGVYGLTACACGYNGKSLEDKPMFRKILFLTLLLGWIPLVVASCVSPSLVPTPASSVESNDPAQIANPASVYCESNGGKVEMRTEADGGQFGVCLFPDGSQCDEWAYFRGECQPGASQVVPSPLPPPAFTNEKYGFSFNPPADYTIEGYPQYIIFRRSAGDYFLFVGFKWADVQTEPFRTGMPSGEFQPADPAQLLGQPLPKRLLLFEDRIKVVEYGPVSVGRLLLYIWLDATQQADYGEIDIPAEAQAEAEQILASFALASGETPAVKPLQP
jgi:putative hemolysin